MFDFKPEYATDAEIPNDFKCYYEAKDGKFLLLTGNPIVASAVANFNSLNGALRSEREEHGKLKATLHGFDPVAALFPDRSKWGEAIPAKIKELTEALAKKTNFDPEEAKKAIAESMKGDITSRDATITSLRNALYEHLVTGQATAALAEHEGMVSLAMPHVQSRLKVEEVNGKFNVVVYDGDVSNPNSKPLFSRVKGGENMGVSEFVETMSKDAAFAPLFKSNKGSGGGTRGEDQRRNNVPANNGGTQMTSREKIAAGLAAQQRG